MKIAISLIPKISGGSIVHLKEILKEWSKMNIQNEYVVFTIPQNVAHIRALFNFKQYKLFKVPRVLSFFVVKSLWEQIFLPFYLKREKIDILFAPENFCPLFSPIKTILMLQNAGPFCNSINVKYLGFYKRVWFKVVGLMMKLSANRAKHVIFISQYLKDQFVRHYGFPTEKGTIIYLGTSNNASQSRKEEQALFEEIGITKPFILFASILYRYKNVPQLIEGFGKAIKLLNDEKLQLVIAGKVINKKYFAKITKVVKKQGLKERVKFLGQVPRQQLFSLYRNCLFFVFPSTTENCPMVLIEAMSIAVPILCSNLSAMPEICRDAALYFDPYNIDDISEKIILMIKNKQLREEMKQKALKRAQEFPTWEEVAKRTFDIIEQVAKEKI